MNFIFNLYKKTLSKILVFLFGSGCRYSPTCSEYAQESLEKFGIIRGTFLSLKRLSRCHPFIQANYFDPVPEN